ncbi:MAG: type VI secretion system tip protein TssI/VgrG [Gammaproteobacteria bacterium]|nr:type VI secretion system tip protein TssI/VgrG [Gammaproteobacteria bacterium]
MQQDGTTTASQSSTSNSSENSVSFSRIPANTSRFTFDLINSSEELRVLEFEGTESISKPFEYKLVLATQNDLLTPEQFMGNSGLLTMVSHEQNELLHGDIAQFEQFSEQGDFLLYRLTLVPRFWFLTKRYNHRIFQELSIPEIIEAVFNDAGINPDDYELRLADDYPSREYCVQYGESEFNFISRLMEENGLHYHFEHQLDKHIMVIADHNGAFPFIQIDKNVQYHPLDSLNADKEVIHRFNKGYQVRHGSACFRDYSFKSPLDRLTNHRQTECDTALEDYHYPGDYESKKSALKSSGVKKTVLKLQQHQTLREESQLGSNCQRLRAGMRYELYDNPNGLYNQQYLLTHIKHIGKQPQSLDEYGAGNASTYSNDANCIPATTSYKSPVKHKKTNLVGYQSSTVTGPTGEEIYTNAHAQTKVQFPWDREGQQDENSSCWLRSSQTWAGKNWGHLILPRMGQETKVGYIHGDPDRPIITGSVYNERHKPPYELPKYKTRSTYKTHSTLGGKGYNEIRIEDRKDQEQVYFHAEKDLDIRAKYDRRDIINHDRHLIVDNNRYEHIKDSSHHIINNNQNEKTGEDHSINIAQTQHSKVGQAVLTDVSQNIHFKAGQKIILEAGVELTIKAGGGFIKIDPSGITAQGASINLNSGTGAGSAANAAPKQPMVAVEADKDKPGQNFKPIPPQAIQESEKVAFKGEISRLLQAGNDNKQGICIPCIFKSLTKSKTPDVVDLIKERPQKKTKQTWLNVIIKDDEGKPVANQKFIVTFDNGHSIKGQVDEEGYAHLEPVPDGKHQIELLEVDMREWNKDSQ